MTEVDEGVLIDAAAELLKAAILLRDLMSAMPVQVRLSMPTDLRDRCFSHGYQSAFDALPATIREQARVAVLDDPSIQEARRIDASTRLIR